MASSQTSQRVCPICSREPLPDDASVALLKPNRVLVSGRVNAIVRPEEAAYPPFSHYCTVSVYPRKGPVKYLKFRSPTDMERWQLKRGDKIQAEGCLHSVDGKEQIFAVGDIIIHSRGSDC